MNKLFAWARGPGAPTPPQSKHINLALQGGGAYGAFTWGVLDHLLEDGRLAIDGLSGASAGALNAVMLADGLVRGGPDEARKRLADFWRAASVDGELSGFQRQMAEPFALTDSLAGASMKSWMHSMGRYLAPGQINPLNINPLRQVIERLVDFEALRNSGRDLFIAATNAQTGALRLFTAEELTPDAVMASAALPMLFRAVRIDGVPYWDGGYSANPPVLPFLHTDDSADVLLVQILPVCREAPRGAREIAARTGEIAFNAPLLAELRALSAFERVADEGGAKPLRLHRILLDADKVPSDPASRLNNNYRFFEGLYALGREAAQQFLAAHFDSIGHRGTLDAAEEAGREHVTA